jgi:mono/diheme cytochrome c family protein
VTRAAAYADSEPRPSGSDGAITLRLTLSLIAAAALLCPQAGAEEGSAVFLRACVRCHSPNSDAHAPMPEEMAKLQWQDILKSFESGAMQAQGAALSVDDRRAVARYLGAASPAPLAEMKGCCTAGAKPASQPASQPPQAVGGLERLGR